MVATLFVPYSNGDCINGFQYERGTITQKEYVRIMETEYDKYRDSIDETVRTSFSKNMSINPFQKQNNKYKQQTFYYNECRCNVLDIKGINCEIDELIRYYQTKEEFIIILDVKNLTSNPDVESDLKQWVSDSNKINNSYRLTEEEKIFNLPKKDFKLKFTNEGSTAILKECKLLEYQGFGKFAILVKNIIFIRE